MSFNSAFDVISLALTVSSLLIGAATFLLGFYLSERERGVPKARLNPFKYLLISLVVPVFVIIVTALCVVIPDMSDSPIDFFLLLIVTISLIPAVAMSIIIAKKS